MSISNSNGPELDVWKSVASYYLSPSHDRWHIDMVLDYARQLSAIHGGDPEVLTAAVIMHDLGRGDKSTMHGEESRRKSVEIAEKLMANWPMSREKKDRILQAIRDHDQDSVVPHSTEGRILKDADFLAGFGAWGVLRAAMWAGESGRDTGMLLDKLEVGLRKRLDGLIFPESQRLALESFAFSRLFLAMLEKTGGSSETRRAGQYIIIEGISGAGKDTQAIRLRQHLDALGMRATIVQEPAEAYKKYRDLWETQHDKRLTDPMVMRYLLMADRFELMKNTVRPALDRGESVISVRSYISTLVYQCEDSLQESTVAFEHSFVPIPDLLIVLDVDEKVAELRTRDRERRGNFEKPEFFSKHRSKYRRLCESGIFATRSVMIDATAPLDDVSEAVIALFGRETPTASPNRET